MTTESERLHTIGVDGISYQKLGVILHLVMFFCFREVNPLFMTHNLSCFSGPKCECEVPDYFYQMFTNLMERKLKKS